VVNEIKLLRKLLLRYQSFNDGIKSKKNNLLTMVLRAKKMALFDFNVTTCKTMHQWQKEGHFTTPVPVDP
jgi:hypothetical protein